VISWNPTNCELISWWDLSARTAHPNSQCNNYVWNSSRVVSFNHHLLYINSYISVHQKSNSTDAPSNIFWMKKSQNTSIWLSKVFLAQQFCTWCWGWQKTQHTLKANTYCWLARLFDWSRWVAIGSLPAFARPVSVFWARLRKSKQLILDVRNTVRGPDTEHGWSCSKNFSNKLQWDFCTTKYWSEPMKWIVCNFLPNWLYPSTCNEPFKDCWLSFALLNSLC
jgi:hypothetical protein